MELQECHKIRVSRNQQRCRFQGLDSTHDRGVHGRRRKWPGELVLGDKGLVRFGAVVTQVVGPEQTVADEDEVVHACAGEQNMLPLLNTTDVEERRKAHPFGLSELYPRNERSTHVLAQSDNVGGALRLCTPADNDGHNIFLHHHIAAGDTYKAFATGQSNTTPNYQFSRMRGFRYAYNRSASRFAVAKPTTVIQVIACRSGRSRRSIANVSSRPSPG